MQTDLLDKRVRALRDERDFSGTVLITGRDGVLVEIHCGLADRAGGVPVEPVTRFGLGSVTKIFTACAVLSLVADGAVDLDAPVVDLLDAERRPSTLRGDVTGRHLLTHTSGIADYFEEETATANWAQEFADLWRDRPVYRMRTPSDFLELFGHLPPYREPGVRFQYSNAGYIVLGLVLEAVTGSEYATVVAERVFAPAGMEASGFFAADEVRPNVAVGYLRPSEPGEPWRTNVFAMPAVGGPDGGAFATAQDLDRFLTAYAEGRIVEPELLDEALRPHARIDERESMGYGVYLIGEGRTRAFGAVGADPGAEALIRRYPELGVNTVVVANVNDSAWDLDAAVCETVTGSA
jgi:CubicO group peptidase (beta-lactamase class C family)